MPLCTFVISVFTGIAAERKREMCTHIASKLLSALGAHSRVRNTWLNKDCRLLPNNLWFLPLIPHTRYSFCCFISRQSMPFVIKGSSTIYHSILSLIFLGWRNTVATGSKIIHVVNLWGELLWEVTKQSPNSQKRASQTRIMLRDLHTYQGSLWSFPWRYVVVQQMFVSLISLFWRCFNENLSIWACWWF